MTEKTLTKEEWANIDRVLSGILGRVELRVDGRNVTFKRVKTGKNTLATMTYIDGEFNGIWLEQSDPVPEQRYLRLKTKALYSAKQRADFKKINTPQIKGLNFDPNKKLSYFTPFWCSGAQLRRHYEKTFNSIELIKANQI